MSSVKTPATSRRKTIRNIAIGAVGVVVAALAFQSVSGADFTASDTGRVDVNTATLTVGLSDGKGSSDTFDLDFDNLAPGDVKTQTIKVTNTGSIPADVKLGAPITQASLSGGSLTGADLNELEVGVVAYKAMTPAPQLGAGTIDLGALNPNQTRHYTVQVGLADSATDEWQGVHVGATATVTLKQR